MLMPSGVIEPTAWSHDCIKKTLADYLVALRTSWRAVEGRIKRRPANTALSARCLHIASEADPQQQHSIHELQQVIEEGYELVFYAVDNLIHHAEVSAVDISQNDFLESFDWIFFGSVSSALGMEFEPGTRMMRLFAEHLAVRLMATAFFLRDKVDFWRFHAEQPLFDAILSDEPSVVQEVLTWPLSPNEVNRNGLTPLHSLVLSDSYAGGSYTVAILRLLIDHGADPHFQDDQGMTVLMRACECEETNESLLSDLIHYSLNSPLQGPINNQGQNALMIALRNGNLHSVFELLDSDYYIDLGLIDTSGRSAMVMACAAGHEDLIMRLFQEKVFDEDSEAALMAVVRSYNMDFSCCPPGERQCAHTRVVRALLHVKSDGHDFFEDIRFESMIAGARRRGDECGWRMILLFNEIRQQHPFMASGTAPAGSSNPVVIPSCQQLLPDEAFCKATRS